MITPVCSGPALMKQIHLAKASARSDRFDVWWLGQSGFLIQWNGVCVLFDPYLSDSLTKKYASTGKPHVRMSEQVILPELLDCIDIVTSSHNHTDHLDAETLIPLLKINTDITFIIPEANRGFVVDRVKCDFDFPKGLNDGGRYAIKGFNFHGVPAAHNTLDRDEKGQCKYMGYVVQFGSWSVYHSGDTLWYETIVDTLKPFHVDISFLPINGNDPGRGVAGNLNAREAAQLGKQAGARFVIPHHYDLFEFNTADPEEFALACRALDQEFRIMKLGGHLAFN